MLLISLHCQILVTGQSGGILYRIWTFVTHLRGNTQETRESRWHVGAGTVGILAITRNTHITLCVWLYKQCKLINNTINAAQCNWMLKIITHRMGYSFYIVYIFICSRKKMEKFRSQYLGEHVYWSNRVNQWQCGKYSGKYSVCPGGLWPSWCLISWRWS